MRELASFLQPDDVAERCGLVLRDGSAVEVRNIHPQPEKSFEIDPAALLEHEHDITGSWHTHPGGTANLSMADHEGFSHWPDLTHFIVGVDGVRAFRFDRGVLVEDDLD